MANQFASFNQASVFSSIPHEPSITLASNCIRDFFGPTVQLVADCLQARGGSSTLSQIIKTIDCKLGKSGRSSERVKMIRGSKLCITSSSGTPSSSSIRASLLVLIQHSIVTYSKTTTKTGPNKRKTIFKYHFDPERARILPRYPRFVEYTKKALGETAAALVEEFLLQGRMRTADAVEATVEQLKQQKNSPASDRYTYREAVLGGFRRLVLGGFIKEVKDIKDEEDGGETEFQDSASTPTRKDIDNSGDPATVSLLQNGSYKSLPPSAVWRVNIRMFHDSLRAVSLGTLVYEMYGHKVQFSGSMVAAALKLAAYKQHAEEDTDYESQTFFTIESIQRYLSKPVLQDLEKKTGGVTVNIHKALVELTEFRNPQVVQETEVADGHPENSKFQITTKRLVKYMHDRIVNQVSTCITTSRFTSRFNLCLSLTFPFRSFSMAMVKLLPESAQY
jgi:hypothetical protein